MLCHSTISFLSVIPDKAVDVIDSARSADPQMVRTVASLASSYPALLTVTGESIPVRNDRYLWIVLSGSTNASI